MRLRTTVHAIGAILLISAPSSLGQKTDKKLEAKTLLSSALERTNPRLAGGQPFKMTARLTVNFKKTFDGSYRFYWASPQKWREEIEVTDYRETTVRNGSQQWTQRNLAFRPLAAAQVVELMRPEFLLQNRLEGLIIESVKDKKERGIHVKCIVASLPGVENKSGVTPMEFCIDESTSLLVQRSQRMSAESSAEFSDYAPFQGKQFARTQRVVEYGKEIVTVKVTDLVEASPSDDLFIGIAGVDPWPTCDDIKAGKLVHSVTPEYLPAARQMGIQGRVLLYAVVGTDGALHDIAVIDPLAKTLDESVVQAVKQWKYQPFMCQDKPIPVETNIEVRFSLAVSR